MLIWQDSDLWETEHSRIKVRPELKVCRELVKGSKFADYVWRQEDVGWAHNEENPLAFKCVNKFCSTGTLGIFLAKALGCKQVILIGLDCKLKPNGDTNWWGKNAKYHPGTFSGCVTGLLAAKKVYGEDIFSCGDNDVFTRQSLPCLVQKLQPEKLEQADWRKRLRVRLDLAVQVRDQTATKIDKMNYL